jgi:hypothetical protein
MASGFRTDAASPSSLAALEQRLQGLQAELTELRNLLSRGETPVPGEKER